MIDPKQIAEELRADCDGVVLPYDKWQPIDTAPKDGSWILLSGGEINYGWDQEEVPPCVVGQYSASYNGGHWQFAWYDSGYYGEYENPTHWMPVPEPPNKA